MAETSEFRQLVDDQEQDRTPQDALKAAVAGMGEIAPLPAELANKVDPQEDQAPKEGAAADTGTVTDEGVKKEEVAQADPFEKRYWDSQSYIQKLQQENADARAERQVRKEAQERADAEASRRPKSKEEQEREATDLLERINRDPRGTIAALQEEAGEKARKSILAETRQQMQDQLAGFEPMRVQAEQQQILRGLESAFPQVKEPEFRKLMQSREVVKQVWDTLPVAQTSTADAVEKLYRDPMFHRMLAMEARFQAGQEFKATAKAGAADQAGQAALARSQSAANQGGEAAGGPKGGKSNLTEEQQFRENIKTAGVSAQARMDAAFKRG